MSIELTAPVLLVFFNRPETLKPVFEQIKIVRPKTLYLYQDGPRKDKYKEDMQGIKQCRSIVEEIDWACDVHRWYQENNMGCDPSGFLAHSWLLKNEEYGIIIEDDIVADPSFFRYCQELLVKYKDDKRVYKICGMNIAGEWKSTDSSYIFSRKGSIWGWATWRRVAEMWDANYSFLNEPDSLEKLKQVFESKELYQEFIQRATSHRDSGKAHFETINYSCKMLNDMLDIVPRGNLISNIGASGESAHSSEYHLIPRGIRVVYNGKRFPMSFPMLHPNEIVEDKNYYKVVNRIMGWGHPYVLIFRRIESIIYRLYHTPLRSWGALFFDYAKRKLKKHRLQ